jgi:hypothetical protein
VQLLIQYLVKDEPDLDRFQTGLFYVNGVPKPGYNAFRFPLAQLARSGSRVEVWGQIRPGKGLRRYRLEVRTHGTWRWAGPTRYTNRYGAYVSTVTAPKGALVRVWSPAQHAFGWPLLAR